MNKIVIIVASTALESVQAAYVSVRTLSSQKTGATRRRFMDVQEDGLRIIVAAARTHGVRRLIDITSTVIAPNAPSEWLRQHWKLSRRC